jgi:HEXXH motif-containing protein
MPEAALPPDQGLVPPMYQMTQADFDALADGAGTPGCIGLLCHAELSKHILLVYEVLVNAASRHADAYSELRLDEAFRLLVRAQEREPGIVARILSLPGVGAWAIGCLPRLDAANTAHPAPRADLAQLGAIAAAAGTRAGLDFELPVRLHDGRLILPSFAPVNTQLTCEYALLSQSAAGMTLHNGGSAYRLATPLPERTRLRVGQADCVLGIDFDPSDPYLTRYLYHPKARVDGETDGGWPDRLAGAWQILADHHRADAAAIATMLSTVVPLTTDRTTRNVSATSTVAFGAIAASLPPDDVTLAETLIHECQHLKLCALLDLIPLVEDGGADWYYAPWRDDPRPVRGLFQGACAFFGVTRFWRQQREHGTADQMLRGHVEFARRRDETLGVTRALLESGELTAAGERFAARMHTRLLDWQHDPVPANARRIAAEVSTEHAATWRLQHVACDLELADRLARSWLDGSVPEDTAAAEAALRVRPTHPARPHDRSLLLTLRYTQPERFRAVFGAGHGTAAPASFDLDPGDRALLTGQHAAAVAAYRAQIRHGASSPTPWAGLVAAARTAGVPYGWQTLLHWVPLAFAVHARVPDADPLELTAWLAAAHPTSGEPLCP